MAELFSNRFSSVILYFSGGKKCNPQQIMKTGNFVFLKRSLYSNTKWKNIHFFNFRESEKLTNYCKKPDAVDFLKDLWK